jgi:hypothetical protein
MRIHRADGGEGGETEDEPASDAAGSDGGAAGADPESDSGPSEHGEDDNAVSDDSDRIKRVAASGDLLQSWLQQADAPGREHILKCVGFAQRHNKKRALEIYAGYVEDNVPQRATDRLLKKHYPGERDFPVVKTLKRHLDALQSMWLGTQPHAVEMHFEYDDPALGVGPQSVRGAYNALKPLIVSLLTDRVFSNYADLFTGEFASDCQKVAGRPDDEVAGELYLSAWHQEQVVRLRVTHEAQRVATGCESVLVVPMIISFDACPADQAMMKAMHCVFLHSLCHQAIIRRKANSWRLLMVGSTFNIGKSKDRSVKQMRSYYRTEALHEQLSCAVVEQFLKIKPWVQTGIPGARTSRLLVVPFLSDVSCDMLAAGEILNIRQYSNPADISQSGAQQV